MKKKTMVIMAIAVVALAAGGLAYRTLASNRSQTSSGVQTATVQRGSVQTTLSSSGNTRSGQDATISWETSGKVGEVTLKQGDIVTTGQVLATLDSSALSTEMITAQQNLISARKALAEVMNVTLQQAEALQALQDAQAALDNLKNTAATDQSQAQLALAQAQSAFDTAQKTRLKMDYPHSSDTLVIQKAQTDYLLAKAKYKEALQEFNRWAKKNLTDDRRVRALSQLLTAKTAMDKALATYNWYLMNYTGTDIAQADAELAVAQANLDQAQANYENLKNGLPSATVALAQAKLADAQSKYDAVKDGPNQDDVAAAQAAVDVAQAAVDRATLTAPFGGTLTQVDVKTGDLVKSGDSAFRIDDLSSIYIDLQVSEVDIQSVKIGQKATITFDAISNKDYTGEVTALGMIATVSQGVVNYPVTVRITDADASILPGMTASVSIITAEAGDVLLVPNKAVKTTSGQHYVLVLFEGQQISVPVTVGLVGDSQTEVTSSQLKEGDTVVTSTTTSSSSTTTTTRQNNEFRGPGGLEAGGPPPGIP